MSTRTAQPGGPLRQERWASADLPGGLLGNLVAKRCATLPAEIRHVIYYLQERSHRDSGLAKIAREIRDKYRDRIGPREVLRIHRAGRRPTPKSCRTLFGELPLALQEDYAFYGDGFGLAELLTNSRPAQEISPREMFKAAELAVTEAAEGLTEYLAELCLNPELPLVGPWYFPELPEVLEDYIAGNAKAAAGEVVTSIGQKVHEAMSYALAERSLVVVEGRGRIGKSYAAGQWCRLNPGKARIVQVPASNDGMSFFREFARGLGTSCATTMKVTQVKQRVEDAMQAGDLLLVLDEAHYAWPQQCSMRGAVPHRVNWLITAVSNHHVPCVLITTPQFGISQRTIEKHAQWASEQWIGRISHFERLPDALTRQDLEAVARVALPDADRESLKGLVSYAMGSAKYLAAIECAAKRARYLAAKAGRVTPLVSDVRGAVRSALASDGQLSEALGGIRRRGQVGHKGATFVPAVSPGGECPQKASELAPRDDLRPARAPALAEAGVG